MLAQVSRAMLSERLIPSLFSVNFLFSWSPKISRNFFSPKNRKSRARGWMKKNRISVLEKIFNATVVRREKVVQILFCYCGWRELSSWTMDRFMEQVAIEASQMYVTEQGKSKFASTVGFLGIFFSSESWERCAIKSEKIKTFSFLPFQTIEKLPDKVLLNIFSYLSHLEICRMGEKIAAFESEQHR